MFTGLIEEVGSVVGLFTNKPSRLLVTAPHTARNVQIGDSIAVNGCCLTVVARQANQITFDLLEETLDCTNFRTLDRESRVNLERALSADGRLGGHFVQGHVDCAAKVLSLEEDGLDQRLEIELPPAFADYVVEKGSVAVNGISLTVAEVSEKSFAARIIPFTKAETNIGDAAVDDLVNLEFDLLAKYLKRMLDRSLLGASR
jgi:riboflavin synthase